jgi:hypothetical protein
MHPGLRDALAETALAGLIPGADRPGLLTLSAGLLLIHDFWDESHEAAQRADDLGERGFSAYWHAIAHRREPDPGNAGYWFRRIGNHPIFPRLAAYAKARLGESPGPGTAVRLVQSGRWDPSAMTAFCANARPGTPAESLALDLQREEMRLLLEATSAQVIG